MEMNQAELNQRIAELSAKIDKQIEGLKKWVEEKHKEDESGKWNRKGM